MDHTPSPCLPDGYHSVARWWWGTRGREILRWAFNVLWTVSGGPADGGFSDRVKGEGEGDFWWALRTLIDAIEYKHVVADSDLDGHCASLIRVLGPPGGDMLLTMS